MSQFNTTLHDLKRQINQFCKAENTCNSNNSSNLVEKLANVNLIPNQSAPNGLNILDGSEPLPICIRNNFFLYNPIFGRINLLSQNNEKLRLAAGNAFSRPEFGSQITNSNNNKIAGATWQNGFPSSCNCYKINRIIEKNFNETNNNNNNLTGPINSKLCNSDEENKIEKKIVTILISYNYNCLSSRIINQEPETLYGYLLFGIFNNYINFFSEKTKNNNIFLSTIDFKKNTCCSDNVIKIFYNQSNNLGKLYRQTENNTPLYELYETNIDIPINNLSPVDKIYIGDNSIKFTNNSNFSSPYITLNNLVNEISNIKKIYCSKNSPFKLSFLKNGFINYFQKDFVLIVQLF